RNAAMGNALMLDSSLTLRSTSSRGFSMRPAQRPWDQSGKNCGLTPRYSVPAAWSSPLNCMRLPRENSQVIRCLVIAVSLGLAPTVACAQGTEADYDRAASFQSLTRHKVLRDDVDPHWIEEGKAFWYR